MKIGFFVLAKNEEAIISPFLDQLQEFADKIVFVDHNSRDQTLSIARDHPVNPKLDIYTLNSNGYPQSLLATHFSHKLFAAGCDYVFFLDCDEFLPFESRKDFEFFLLQKESIDVLKFHWLNVSPESFNGEDIFKGRFYKSNHISPFQKIAISKSILLKDANFGVKKGYHDVESSRNSNNLATEVIKDLKLIHIPIQSIAQATLKVLSGQKAIQGDKDWAGTSNGAHWSQMATDLMLSRITEARMRAMVTYYSEQNNFSVQVDSENLSPLDFSFPYLKSSYTETSENLASRILTASETPKFSNVPNDVHFLYKLDGSLEKTFKENDNQTNFPDFQNNESDLGNLASSQIDFLKDYDDLIAPLFAIPFMVPGLSPHFLTPVINLLINAIRPQLLVEISGADESIFCAAINRLRNLSGNTTSIFIEEFSYIKTLKRYKYPYENSRFKDFLTDYFPKASTFSSESRAFDLIVNGTVTCLIVNEPSEIPNYEFLIQKWMSKLSSDGVLIIVGLHLGEPSKVLSYWNSLKINYCTLEFNVMHGIGVVFLNPGTEIAVKLINLERDQAFRDGYRRLIHGICKLGASLNLVHSFEHEDGIEDVREKLRAIENSRIWRFSEPWRRFRGR